MNIELRTTPDDCDLRDFAFMPLHVVRLRDSGIAIEATGDEFRAAVLLWCASWHQVPAGSLPDNERALASLAGYGRDVAGWKSVRAGALRGWKSHGNGRMYHPVICAVALEAWQRKRAQRERTRNATLARRSHRQERHGDRNVVRNVHQGTGTGTGTVKGEDRESVREGAPPPAPPLAGTMPPDGWDWDTINTVADKPTVAMPTAMRQGYFDARTSSGWVDARNRPVARTRTALESDLRKWRTAEPSHASKKRGASTLVNTWHDPNPDQSMRKAF